MLTHDQIKENYNLSFTAYEDTLERIDLIYLWKWAFQKHLKIGEDWNEPYSFPELFGITQRRRNNLLDFLPDMRVKGDGNSIIAQNASLEHTKRISNLRRAKVKALGDAVDVGVGWVFAVPTRFEKDIKTKKGPKTRLMYDGYSATRIDPRDIIPAYSATELHDHTGENYCPYLFRRRLYTKSSFKRKFTKKKGFTNTENIQTTSFSNVLGWRPTTEQESLEKAQGDYIGVVEYWDQESDMYRIYAGELSEKGMIFDSKEGIPYEHKQLPFHAYYNYKREDSLAGIGEIELNIPYDLFRETVLNLMIDDAKLALQPAHIIDGDIQFNTEENELEAGAVFTARGLKGGKIQDSIMPFRAGGITSDVFQVMQALENSQIAVTQDDFRSLFANPNQLATQTLAKREALLKGVRTNVQLNMTETEFYLTSQLVSYLQNELAEPYQDDEGKTVFRKISINGFSVRQAEDGGEVKFEKSDREESKFALNPTVAKSFSEDIEVIPAQEDEEIKRDQNEKLMMFMQQVMGIVQANPQTAQAILGGMDIGAFIRNVSQNLGQSIDEIFPKIAGEDGSGDPVAREHDSILMGITPPVRPMENSYEEFFDHQKFMETKIYKEAVKENPSVKKAMETHLLLTIQNVQQQVTNPSAKVGTPQAPQAGPEGGMGQLQRIPNE